MDTVLPPKNSNKKKLIIIATISVFVLIAGVVAGLFLLGQRQLIEQEASVPTGVARVTINPETKSVNVGETFTSNILFDTANTAIAAITIQLEYTFEGSSPPITVEDIQINSTLPVDELWDFPVKSARIEGNKVIVRIAGFSNSVSGYTTTGQENLATVTFKGQSAGTITAVFNPTESKMTKKSDGSDTLLTPSSQGRYTVGGGAATTPPSSSTPTPTGAGSTPTPTSTSAGTTATPTPTSTSAGTTATPTPTSTPSTGTGGSTATPVPIPETGVSTPLIFGMGIGTLLLVGAMLLAL